MAARDTESARRLIQRYSLEVMDMMFNSVEAGTRRASVV